MSTSGRSVRRPVIAGSWYPGTERSLARTVDDYLQAVEQQPVPGVLLGLIAPHAGYAYSGQTAAYAYRQLAGQEVETIVPILMSADEPDVARELAAHLAEIARDRGDGQAGRVLFVASSDLHHIDDYEQVAHRDAAVREALAAMDVQALTARLMAPQSTVCGRLPILTVVHAARALGANAAQILHHTNSAEVTGEHRRGQYCVGYMAAAIYQAAQDR